MAIKFGRPIEMRDAPRRDVLLPGPDLVVRPRRNRKAEWARRLEGRLAVGGRAAGAAIHAFLARALAPVITGAGVGASRQDDGQGG